VRACVCLCVLSICASLCVPLSRARVDARHAEPAYRLLGSTGLDRPEAGAREALLTAGSAPVNEAVHGPAADIGYHCRAGGHDVLEVDWDRYLTFAALHFEVGGPPASSAKL
jgi:hypothetical protein